MRSRLFDNDGGRMHDASVAVHALHALHCQPPAHHVQGICCAHAHNACARARCQPQQWGHLPVSPVLYQIMRYPPAHMIIDK